MSDQSSSSTASSPAASSPAASPPPVSPPPASSPVPIPVTPSLSLPVLLPLTETVTRTPASLSSENWTFVDDYIRNLGSDIINWKDSYFEGQRQGYFKNYSKPVSLKSAYQSWKTNNDETE